MVGTSEASSTAEPPAARITHLHAFRGIAIMLIVASHVGVVTYFWFAEDKTALMPFWAASETFAHYSTVFFALISGLLFSAVLAGRGWGDFFRAKLRNVVAPYAFFTLLLTGFFLDFWGEVQVFSGGPLDFLSAFFGHLVNGSAALQYWYLPVLCVLFGLTPGLAWALRQVWAKWFLALLLCLPLFLERTYPHNSLANILIFLAPYAFGIWLGADYPRRLADLAKWRTAIAVACIAGTIAMYGTFYAVAGPNSLTGEPYPGPINWFKTAAYVQKMSLACLVLFWLQAREGWLPGWLDRLATHSFAIYFIHVATLTGLLLALKAVGTEFIEPALFPLATAALYVGTLFGTLMLSIGLKRLLGRRSRMIIGA